MWAHQEKKAVSISKFHHPLPDPPPYIELLSLRRRRCCHVVFRRRGGGVRAAQPSARLVGRHSGPAGRWAPPRGGHRLPPRVPRDDGLLPCRLSRRRAQPPCPPPHHRGHRPQSRQLHRQYSLSLSILSQV